MPPSINPGIKPYSAIILSVSLFVILDLSILALNFHIAHQIDEDSLAINLAGRQRMLTQQMAKQVLEQRNLASDSPRWQELQQQFDNSYKLFDSTLRAFMVGGTVLDSTGLPVALRLRQDTETLPILQKAQLQWQSYQTELLAMHQNGDSLALGLGTGDQLLATVNQLTSVLEQQARNKAGMLRWFQSAAVIVVLVNFAIILWQVRRRFESVANSNAMLRNLVDKMSTAVLLFNEEEKIRYANKAAGILFKYSPDEMFGKLQADIFLSNDDSVIGQRSDGSEFTAHIEISKLVFEGNPVNVVTITDITQHQEKHAHWRHLAYHDSLTGLPNRMLFEHRIKQDLSAAQRHDEFVALLTVDLNDFKLINDTYGHLAGDEVLRTMALRFRNQVRTEDLVARLGGDEFVIVLTRFQSEAVAKKTAQTICSVLMEAIVKPVITKHGEVAVSGSIGVSFYPIDGEHLFDIMHESDASMYRAKTLGVGCEILAIA